ncbi:unnamed protein product [Symbiodinium sp. KB8]|nr:unnamed protein product [Symbiodinium sp. KB8]
MSMGVLVTLLSGDQTHISVTEDALVDVLRQKAQKKLNASIGPLITASGSLLQGSATLKQAGLQDGDTVTAVLRDAALAATTGAFALIRGDGSVVAWGHPGAGGDCSAVQEQLQQVKCIKAAAAAFAALREDGSVVTWGGHGGHSAEVQEQLHDVSEIQATFGAFAALRTDGSVVAWGDPDAGGAIPDNVRARLRDVKQIQANALAFVALRGDGTVVTWGHPLEDADSGALPDLLQDVLCVQACRLDAGFVAIKADSVVAWGFEHPMLMGGFANPGGSRFLRCGLQISRNAWAAVSQAGHLSVEFGRWNYRANFDIAEADKLHDVEHLQCCAEGTFAAIRRDGTVATIGDKRNKPAVFVEEELKNVVQVQSNRSAFAAIRGDGSVVTWGPKNSGGNSDHVKHLLSNVKAIQASERAFAAIRDDGSVVAWGPKQTGGDSSAVQTQLKDVKCIQSTDTAFAAIRTDGSVVTWGDVTAGGYSRHVSTQLGRSAEEDEESERLAVLAMVQASASAPTKATEGLKVAKSKAKPNAARRPKPKAKPKAKSKAKARAKAKAKASRSGSLCLCAILAACLQVQECFGLRVQRFIRR